MTNPWKYPASRILRGALIGCGQVSAFHMRAWRAIENVEIVALSNRTIEKAFLLAQEHNIPREHIYQSFADLISNEQLDFVDIATAPEAHADQVLAAVENGLHVLCQKPFAPSLDEALGMVHASELKGVLLSINENWRWRNWYRRIKEILASKTIGTPNYLYIKRHNNGTLPGMQGEAPALLVKQPYTKDLKHLILFEWGIHVVDVARFLFGDALNLYASSQRISQEFQGEDRMILQIKFSGLDAILDISWATVSSSDEVSQLEQVIIEGDQGTLSLCDKPQEEIRIENRQGITTQPAYSGSSQEAYQDSYTQAQRHFIDCLRSGCLPETHARDNLKTLAMVFAAYESAEKNQVVDFNDFLKAKGCCA